MNRKNLQTKSKEELIEIISKLKGQKKYGLVWEMKSENVVEQCRKELPVLIEDKDKSLEKDKKLPTNLIIEGDNYHSLSVLNYTHAGKIDAIYADPPYNTGAKNWVYNNNYVDSNDTFRHSKWLSFMEKRLKLAHSLLKRNGIIVITIDDNEFATLKLLLDEIFGETNYLGTVVIKNNPQGRSNLSGFQISHEYALFYSRSASSKIGRLPRTEEQISRYKDKDSIGPFEWRNFRAQYSTESPRMRYPIFVMKDGSDFRIPKMKWNADKQEYDVLEKPRDSEVVSLPIDSKGRVRTWKWSKTKAESVKETELGVRFDIDKNPTVYYKGRLTDNLMLPYTIWDKSDYSASSMGTNLLKSMIGAKKFDYPKSLYAVIDSLKVLSDKQDATFLDFFAGSGTTGHAVLELNKEDGGNRKFILCTNNEDNNGGGSKVAEDICYPRVKKVINGYGKIKGIPANLRYFKTSFVSKSNVSDDTKRELVARSTEMICVRENTFDELVNNKKYKIYKNNQIATGILFDLDSLVTLKKKLTEVGMTSHIYVFSLTNDTYSEDFADLELKYELCAIPESILEVYRKIFK